MAILGIGPWGSLAGAALFWLIGDTLGVSFSPGEGAYFPEGWPVLWLLLGLTLGFAASSYAALRLMERSPRVLGGIVTVFALLSVAATIADSSGWDTLAIWIPGLLLAVVVVCWGRWRRD